MARLNEKDLLLLDTNKTVSMQGVGYAYLGGNFTENPKNNKTKGSTFTIGWNSQKIGLANDAKK